MWDPKGLRPRWKLSRIEVVVATKMTRMPYLYRSCSVREEWRSWRDRNVVSGFFAKNDVQLKACYGCWPRCMLYNSCTSIVKASNVTCIQQHTLTHTHKLYTWTHTYTYMQLVYLNIWKVGNKGPKADVKLKCMHYNPIASLKNQLYGWISQKSATKGLRRRWKVVGHTKCALQPYCDTQKSVVW